MKICAFDENTGIAEIVASEDRAQIVRIPDHYWHGIKTVSSDPSHRLLRHQLYDYKNRGTGYIGSNLVTALLEKGHQVKCLDRLFFGRESLQPVLSRWMMRGDKALSKKAHKWAQRQLSRTNRPPPSTERVHACQAHLWRNRFANSNKKSQKRGPHNGLEMTGYG